MRALESHAALHDDLDPADGVPLARERAAGSKKSWAGCCPEDGQRGGLEQVA